MSTLTATTTTRKKSTKPVARTRVTKSVKASALNNQMLTGQALLKDMKLYSKKVVATPKSAREFLTRLGVMTTDGKSKKLIRG
jgi:NAD-specific glutamate dehydrogenase